jgi:hypothetical protein
VWAQKRGGAGCPAGGAGVRAANGDTPPSPPYNGTPPLVYNGGPVAGTTIPGELTVTPVYWVPAGSSYSFPTDYESLLNQFFTDVAADSGNDTNVFWALEQYTNAEGTHLSYLVHAGTPIVDTDALPTNGCTPDTGHVWSDDTGYSACLTDAQLQSEATSVASANSLPLDLGHLYMMFLPEGVEVCFTSADGAHHGSCSTNSKTPGFCGYHTSSAAASPLLMAAMPYAVVDSPTGYTCSSDGGSNTGGNQSPNGDIAADTEVSVASHETNETITDPEGNAWLDSSGNEIADDCAYIYGDSSSFQGTSGAYYNQTINGDHYFIQGEFSNQAFSVDPDQSCVFQGPYLLSITASSATMTQGGSVPAITPSFLGFVNGDTPASLSTQPTCTTTATATSLPGSYPSSCSGASDPDYAIEYVDGTVTVQISCGAASFAITTSSLPNGTVGAFYSATLTGCGGTPPYVFKKVGRLPRGLVLSSSGTISGTPKKTGTISFRVKMTDHARPKDVTSAPFSITVG